MGWALVQARAGQAVVSGFHPPLEQSVLKVLMVAKAPAVLVLAQPVAGAHLPTAWMDAVRGQHLLVVSAAITAPAAGTPRLTAEVARERNEVVARLVSRIVIGHAAPGGQLAQQVAAWQASGVAIELPIGS